MNNWITMVSCSERGYKELHQLLKQSGGLYTFDRVQMPPDCNNDICSIRFQYVSPRSIHLSCIPAPSAYHGTDPRIAAWVQEGTAEFGSFNELKAFLKSFADEGGEPPQRPSCTRDEPRKQKEEEPPAPIPPEPQTIYDKDGVHVPGKEPSYILVDKDKLLIDLQKEIFGQDENLEKIVHLVVNHLATKHKKRPLSVFIYGPPGTGKSAAAEALVKLINRELSPKNRLCYKAVDCTQFQERGDITRLTGAAPGYIGFDEPGVFASLEENPNTVFVFEEIEKAAPNVSEVIMQAMETGRQDTNGKTLKNGKSYYDLSGCIIFFTSNIVLENKRALGFDVPVAEASPQTAKPEHIARIIGDETKEAKRRLLESGKFRREVISRMNAVVKFNQLSGDVMKDVAVKCISDIARDYHLLYLAEIDTPILQQFLDVTLGQAEDFGVRSLRNEAQYYFNDCMMAFSHKNPDYTKIKLSGTLDRPDIQKV